ATETSGRAKRSNTGLSAILRTAARGPRRLWIASLIAEKPFEECRLVMWRRTLRSWLHIPVSVVDDLGCLGAGAENERGRHAIDDEEAVARHDIDDRFLGAIEREDRRVVRGLGEGEIGRVSVVEHARWQVLERALIAVGVIDVVGQHGSR